MKHPQGQGVQHFATTLMCLLASVLNYFPQIAELFCSTLQVSCFLVSVIAVTSTLTVLFKGRKATRCGGENTQLGVLKNEFLALFFPLALLCNAE